MPGTFRVEVVRSPAGEASAIVELDPGALLARRDAIQAALLASAGSVRPLAPDDQPLREVGRALFAALLGSGEVAGQYRASGAIAAERRQRLRVVLRIDTPELAGLPWEAMYDEAGGAYVCRTNQLVRHIPVASVPAPLAVRPPLRILAIASSPRDLPALDIDRERGLLDEALAGPVSEGLAQLHWAPSATWADLHDLFLREEWHVLHFIGHSDFDPQRGGVLALTRPDGGADLFQASRFADLLRQARHLPRLVVLNSCSGAATGRGDLFSSAAAALVRGGVSAVAAMQFQISDVAAAAFARGFYAAIAHDRGVDEAASSGRVAILGTSGHTLEWVTPVLYLRGHGTELFARPADLAVTNATTRPNRAGPDGAGPDRTRPERVMVGHTGGVMNVAFSQDGALLATTSWDKTARIWHAASGTPLRTLSGHTAYVSAAAFSPDGTMIATASADRTARLWDPATGTLLRTLTGHTAYVSAAAFSPDGTMIATASADRTARLWDPATGTLLRTFAGHSDSITTARFSPDGTIFATASQDKTVRLWNPGTGHLVRTLTGHSDFVEGLAFSSDGALLATASRDGTARLWDAPTGIPLRICRGHRDAVNGVAISQDGALLATASRDGTARLWLTATCAPVRTFAGQSSQPGIVTAIAFSPDGTMLATASTDQSASLWAVRDAASTLPASLRFLAAAAMEPPEPTEIRDRWATGVRTTTALLGWQAGGPFLVDLARGPHMLVAGTTGSGKSDLLQTLLASLAVANSPTTMNFILIDHKGGYAFRDCQLLPHTVGVVSDLDESLLDRSLTALQAELGRRRTLLSQAGANDLEAYWQALPATSLADPLPRLVIVIDEFSALAEQFPQHMAVLIEIGQQGRALGVHLVLATQRPAGVLSAALLANLSLRIALRVSSSADSREVIGAADAAQIPAQYPGRAFARLGDGQLIEFQAARVSDSRPPTSQGDLATAETDLSALVAAISAAARQEGQAPQHALWLPPLPDVITLGQVAGATSATPEPATAAMRLVFGMIDRHPDRVQEPAAWDLARGGNLLIAGAPRSGRTTLLRTLAAGACTQLEPDDAHMYVIDCGGGLAGLAGLADLPQCGAVLTAGEPDRIGLLLATLGTERRRRAQLLADAGYGDFASYRSAQPPASRPPFLLLFIDHYNVLEDALEFGHGQFIAELWQLMAGGHDVGITVVATGGRELIAGRPGRVIAGKIILRMADPTDYAVAGLKIKRSGRWPPGRGFRLPGPELLQVAVLSTQADQATENNALRQYAKHAVPPTVQPFRIDQPSG